MLLDISNNVSVRKKFFRRVEARTLPWNVLFGR